MKLNGENHTFEVPELTVGQAIALQRAEGFEDFAKLFPTIKIDAVEWKIDDVSLPVFKEFIQAYARATSEALDMSEKKSD